MRISDMHTGRAGEYLAAADILIQGYDCFHAAQGMPYDLVVDTGNRLLKVQVKAASSVRPVPQRKTHIPAYLFWINRCGKRGAATYAVGEVDLFALVAVDERSVGYIAPRDLPRTLVVRSEKMRGEYHDEVIADRNTRVLSFLKSGASVSEACIRFGLDKAYVHRVVNGAAITKGAGVYLKDLPLSKALHEY